MGFDANGFIGTWFGSATGGSVTLNYNWTMTQDCYWDDLTISDGVTVNTNGFRIFVRDTLTINGSGRIANNGSNGGFPSGGSGAAAYQVGGGKAGAYIQNSQGSGYSGFGWTIPVSIGGVGGAGGAAYSGYSGGSAGQASWSDTGAGTFFSPLVALTGGHIRYFSSSDVDSAGTCVRICGGSGGGGGALYDNGVHYMTDYGGSGGGGGGIVYIAASKILLNGTSSIQANGGSGGAGYVAAPYMPYAGGGGGGGGGGIIINCGTITLNSSSNSLQTYGGPGGSGAAGGATGSSGANGKIILFSESGSTYFTTTKVGPYTL